MIADGFDRLLPAMDDLQDALGQPRLAQQFRAAEIPGDRQWVALVGLDAVDQPRQLYLCELALEFCREVLKPGGSFLAKVFQGAGFDAYLRSVKAEFDKVRMKKPPASRARSAEMYLLATGRRIL